MFAFHNLDDTTRKHMLEAIDEADQSGNIYKSARFNQAGIQQWPALLKQAAQNYNEHWLAYQLEANVLMKDFEASRTKFGDYTTKHVPHTAAETIAEGQFNRFYILGLCRRARAQGIIHLTVYRAKPVNDPRLESQAIIGRSYSIDELEAQLKNTQESFKSPLARPNSGLSVELR